MTASINGTTGVTFPDASVQGTAATGFGFKNRIINGACMIDQRNAGASVNISTDSTYVVDRWINRTPTGAGVKYSVQRSATAPAGFVNSQLFTSASSYSVQAGDYYWAAQFIEGFNVADLAWGTANAAPVTLSFWARSSLTGTFCGSLVNGAYNRSNVFTYTISSANTWEYKTVTLSGDTTGTWATDNTLGLQVRFDLGSGSNNGTSTLNAWQAGNFVTNNTANKLVSTSGATLYITGVQLEKGSTATSFDYRPYGTELALCQRYFQIEKGDGGYSYIGGPAWVRTNNTFVQTFRHTVPMRTSPTGASLGAWYSGDSTATNYQIGTSSVNVHSNSIYSSTIDFTGAAGGTFNAGGSTSPNSGPSNTGGYTLSAEL